jgi:hypothetical protein
MTSGVKAALLGLTHPHALAHLRTLQAVPSAARVERAPLAAWAATGRV